MRQLPGLDNRRIGEDLAEKFGRPMPLSEHLCTLWDTMLLH